MNNNTTIMTTKPILHLAPMCNITNRATRQIAKDFGCDITWSEMISSEGLVRNHPRRMSHEVSTKWDKGGHPTFRERRDGGFLRKGGHPPFREKRDGGFSNKSLKLAQKFNKTEAPYWVQIFGTDPQTMTQAAKIIEQEIKPTGIDINLGCPVPKARKGGYGAVQIGRINQVVTIIKAIKKEISISLSLKTRLGLTEPTEILKFAPRLVEAGLDQLVIHARTLKGMFKEEPNWEIVRKLNDTLEIPVIYNGGIKTPEDAQFYMKKTGCQNLMIGQASIGNPWLFKEIKNYFQNLPTNNKITNALITSIKINKLFPDQQTKINTILHHAELVVSCLGEKGLIGFRTQLSAYLKNLQAPKSIRQQAVQITNLQDLKNLLKQI